MCIIHAHVCQQIQVHTMKKMERTNSSQHEYFKTSLYRQSTTFASNIDFWTMHLQPFFVRVKSNQIWIVL